MFSPQLHRILFVFGTCALFFGVMLGTVPTSVPQFILLGNWLLEGNFSEKLGRLKSNKIFWVLSSLFLIHVIGLFYTEDMQAGWNDVRTKIPLIYLPLIYFSTAPLKKKEFYMALYAFIGGAFINVSWCLFYKHVLHHSEQIREVSRFMSHIRLGFLIDLAIIFCIYFLATKQHQLKRLAFGALGLYFVYSLYTLGLISGFVNLAIISVAFVIFWLYRINKFYLIGFLSVLVFIGIFIINKAGTFYNANFTPNSSEVNKKILWTKAGRPFNHHRITNQVENGFLVAQNIQEQEIQNIWNKRVPNDSIDLATEYNLTRYYTLIRFISSKGQTKDSVSVSMLSDKEIEQIREGITNVNYADWSFMNKRLYELMYEYYEYRNNGTANGHSFTMRLFFLKAAGHVIRNNPIVGVGTGDVQQKMNEAYELNSTPLDKEWYKRPHNQFVTITVALGIIGLMIFLISLIYPVITLYKELGILYGLFLASAIISFLFEDTLETQIGLSFFAIFNTLFLSRAYFKKQRILQD